MGLFQYLFRDIWSISQQYGSTNYDNLDKSSKFDVLKSRIEDIKIRQAVLLDQKLRLDFENKVPKKLYFANIYIEEKNDRDGKLVKFRVNGKIVRYIKDSCGVFQARNQFRQLCIIIVQKKILSLFTSFFIIIHCAMMSQLTFYKRENGENMYYDYIFIFFNFLYLVEIVIKIIAQGMMYHKNSFMRDIFNAMDFLCLLVSIYGIFNPEYRYYEIIKLYRTTIVMRKFKVFKNLDLMVKVIYNARKQTITIISFLLFYLAMLAILGQNLFSGLFNYRCRLTPKPVNGEWLVNQSITRLCSNYPGLGYKCPDGNYCGSDYQYKDQIKPELFLKSMKIQEFNYGISKYDNFVDSILTSFHLLYKTDWQEIMYIQTDIYAVEVSCVYILLIIIICNYFIGNMIVASMMFEYNFLTRERTNVNVSAITNLFKKNSMISVENIQKQSRIKIAFNKIKNFIFYDFPHKNVWMQYKPIRRFFYKLSLHPIFRFLTYIVVISNCIILSLDQYPIMYKDFDNKVYFVNLIFHIFFIFEQAIKLYGQGFKYLQNDKIDLFDFVITCISSIKLFFNYKVLKALPSLRVLRLFRIFLTKNDRGNSISILTATFFDIVPVFLSFSFVFLINSYIFSIIGMNIFQEKLKFKGNVFDIEEGESPRSNFDTFPHSMASVFQIVLRQKWNQIWYQCYISKGSVAHYYFITLLIIAQFILFQSFMAIMLGIFQQNRKKQTQMKDATKLVFENLFGEKQGSKENQPRLTNKIQQQIKDKISMIRNKKQKSPYLSGNKKSPYLSGNKKSPYLSKYNSKQSGVVNNKSNGLLVPYDNYEQEQMKKQKNSSVLQQSDVDNNKMYQIKVNGEMQDSESFSEDDSSFDIDDIDHQNDTDKPKSTQYNPSQVAKMQDVIGKITKRKSVTMNIEYLQKIEKSIRYKGTLSSVINDYFDNRKFKDIKKLVEMLDPQKNGKKNIDLVSTRLSKPKAKTKKVISKNMNMDNSKDEQNPNSDHDCKSKQVQKVLRNRFKKSNTYVQRNNNADNDNQDQKDNKEKDNKDKDDKDKKNDKNQQEQKDDKSQKGQKDNIDEKQRVEEIIRQIKSSSLKGLINSKNQLMLKVTPFKQYSNFMNKKKQVKTVNKTFNTKAPLSKLTIMEPTFNDIEFGEDSSKGNNNDNEVNINYFNYQNFQPSFYRSSGTMADLNKFIPWHRKVINRIRLLTYREVVDYMKQSSFFIFHQESKIRITITKILSTKFWDRFTLMLIFANGINLALDNPLSDKSSILPTITKTVNMVFTVIFLIEMAMKMISLSPLFNSKNQNLAYISSSWNHLDFVVVVSGAIDLWFLENSNSIQGFKVLRLFRALRPLKVINKNEQLKIIVNTLFKIVPQLLNLIQILSIIVILLGIIMMQQFKGEFYNCYDHEDQLIYWSQEIQTKTNCIAKGYIWKNSFYNYDNIMIASLSIFKILTGGYWKKLLDLSVDANGIDNLAKKNNNKNVWVLYYIIIITGNVMILNLMVGLVLDNFKQTKDDLEGYLNLDQEQKEWADLQRFMQKRKLKVVVQIDDQEQQSTYMKIKNKCFTIGQHKYFELFIIFCTFVNIIIMGFFYEGMNENLRQNLEIVNNVFLGLFHMEFIIKFIGNGLNYFKDSWNIFDLIIILVTDIAYIVFNTLTDFPGALKFPLVLRGIKFTKLLKYLQHFKTISITLNTYNMIFGQLVNIGLVFFLFIFIFAILGMNVFAPIKIEPYQDGIRPHKIFDFSSFLGSVLLLIQCATLQRWDYYLQQIVEKKPGCLYQQTVQEIRRDGINGCGSWFGFPYFITFIIIVPLVTMNLFIAVVVQGFEISIKENEAALQPKDLDTLIEKWAEYDPDATGFISPYNFAFMLYELPPPIGLMDENNLHEQFNNTLEKTNNKNYFKSPNKKFYLNKKQIFEINKQYNLILYQNNMIHFKDVYLCISHNAICKKFRLENLEIKEKYVIMCLNRGWYRLFPYLKKLETENKKNINLNSLDYLALMNISQFIHRWKEEKNYKILLKKFHLDQMRVGEEEDIRLLKQQRQLKQFKMNNYNIIQDGCYMHSDMLKKKNKQIGIITCKQPNNQISPFKKVTDFNQLYRSKSSQDHLLRLFSKKYLEQPKQNQHMKDYFVCQVKEEEQVADDQQLIKLKKTGSNRRTSYHMSNHGLIGLGQQNKLKNSNKRLDSRRFTAINIKYDKNRFRTSINNKRDNLDKLLEEQEQNKYKSNFPFEVKIESNLLDELDESMSQEKLSRVDSISDSQQFSVDEAMRYEEYKQMNLHKNQNKKGKIKPFSVKSGLNLNRVNKYNNKVQLIDQNQAQIKSSGQFRQVDEESNDENDNGEDVVKHSSTTSRQRRNTMIQDKIVAQQTKVMNKRNSLQDNQLQLRNNFLMGRKSIMNNLDQIIHINEESKVSESSSDRSEDNVQQSPNVRMSQMNCKESQKNFYISMDSENSSNEEKSKKQQNDIGQFQQSEMGKSNDSLSIRNQKSDKLE